MKCYIQSDPSKKEEKKKKKKKKRKRMVTIWAEKGVFETNYGFVWLYYWTAISESSKGSKGECVVLILM